MPGLIFDNLARQRRLRQLIATDRDRLYRLAWSWCHDRDRAEDLVQETQARALARLGDLRNEARAGVWLTRILANLYRDSFRRPCAEPLHDEALVSDDADPETLVERSEQVARARRAIARLNREQRLVLTLVDLGGFSYAETADILDIPAGTVMSRLSRARQRLRELLQRASAGPVVVPLRGRT